MIEGFAITITLTPKCYRWKSQRQLELLHTAIIKHMFKKTGGRRYYISLIPEKTNQCNIHAHGIIKLIDDFVDNCEHEQKEILYDIFRVTPRCIGYVYIKPITNLQEWINYCKKDGAPAIIDDLDYFMPPQLPA